jgi:hypothetical protein
MLQLVEMPSAVDDHHSLGLRDEQLQIFRVTD